MVTNIHEHKRYYYTFDNSLLFTESIQNTTQIFPRQIITSGFFRVSTKRWHNAIRVRAKPCVHRFNCLDTPAEKFPVKVDIVNPGIQ